MAKKLVRCAACGYVMAEDKLGAVCPACGALRKVFAPYEDPMSESRRLILNLDLHPIAVHFPVAFSAFLVALAAVPFFADQGPLLELTSRTGRLVAILTPVSAIVAIFTGLLDGQIRFRRVDRAPYLRLKILLGLLFFILTTALAILLWMTAAAGGVVLIISLLLALAALVCAFFLGLIGGRLLEAAFPGK